MKKPGLFLPLLFAALLGSCNPDVFIDSCAPATDQLQVPADGTAATLRFGSGNWYVRGLFLKKQGLYEEIRGDIYNADGTQLYFDVPFHFSDLGGRSTSPAIRSSRSRWNARPTANCASRTPKTSGWRRAVSPSA